jgi:hypothetical protein
MTKENCNQEEIAADFFRNLAGIDRREFFSHTDLFRVKEVIERIMDIESFLSNAADSGFNNLPQSGFRFAYFPNDDYYRIEEEVNVYSFNHLAYKAISDQAKKLGYIFYADEAYAYVGIPEKEFFNSYVDKFQSAFEDA